MDQRNGLWACLLSLAALAAGMEDAQASAPQAGDTAATDTVGQEAAASPARLDESQYDPDNGQEIMEICAACHGEFGEGGAGGEYPRLAGLSAEYIAGQLRAFKSRERLNIPMLPYATERELPEDDVRDISLYLSRIELLTTMPALPDSVGAYERLMIAKRVLNVARVEGDPSRGEAIYMKSCRRCHGKTGLGGKKTPPLAGQHTAYLRLQIEKFLAGERDHKKMEKYLRPYSDEDWEALLAFLATLDD